MSVGQSEKDNDQVLSDNSPLTEGADDFQADELPSRLTNCGRADTPSTPKVARRILVYILGVGREASKFLALLPFSQLSLYTADQEYIFRSFERQINLRHPWRGAFSNR